MADLEWRERLDPHHPAVTGKMVKVPGKSNICSVGYDSEYHFVYVRFKGGPDQSAERHGFGALFRYCDVPLRVFLELLV